MRGHHVLHKHASTVSISFHLITISYHLLLAHLSYHSVYYQKNRHCNIARCEYLTAMLLKMQVLYGVRRVVPNILKDVGTGEGTVIFHNNGNYSPTKSVTSQNTCIFAQCHTLRR
jgi:hypothetical protein